MTTPQMILFTIVFLVFLFFAVRFLHLHAPPEDLLMPPDLLVPRQIAVSEMDDYEPQDVYDWVVYVTKMTGRGYLEQLAFPPGCRHAYLLQDLRTTLRAQTTEELLEWLTEVGYSHRLSTAIVNQPC